MKLVIFIFLFITFTSIVSAQDYSGEQIHKIAKATRFVTTTKLMLQKSLKQCGIKFKNLKPLSDSAYKHWIASNNNIINLSDKTYRSVLDFFREKGSDTMADAYNEKIQKIINKESSFFVIIWNKDTPKNQKEHCQKLTNSIMAGEWDIKKKNPSAYNFIISK